MPRSSPRRLGLVLLLVLAPAAAAAEAAPRSMAECERLKNDLAYNQCLAMFGPAAKNIAGGGADGAPMAAPAAAATTANAATSIPEAEDLVPELGRSRRGRHRYGRRGRQSASFTVGGEGSGSYRRRRRR
ncbi:hypothetical protein [Methylobacterium sp. A54F]